VNWREYGFWQILQPQVDQWKKFAAGKRITIKTGSERQWTLPIPFVQIRSSPNPKLRYGYEHQPDFHTGAA
jgi:hypothetical protein